MSYKLSCPMLVSTALMAMLTTASLTAHASVTPDRTRLVFNESDKSISVTLRNNNEKLPYGAKLAGRREGQQNHFAAGSTAAGAAY